MAERTTSDDVMTRAELASYLSSLAQEFDDGNEEIAVAVGNKTVSLSPPENVNASVDVVERSSILRGERETITIELSWKP
ncbi:amphi-Trp domain-containing protein [Natronococcus pandeyae]|uniref:Amphi-Trp domain-containing protein n=1 Tax=Natronococcus pandeyae TaxID=2055836 RepID=A0A8J8TQT0_9EURY|nr:amphi-Trp domain-containing protein [Natronococcus pandeyae]TYL36832.1 amphi-Trp domain-containing protein [Natronococcus pandeyae]